MAGRIDQLFHIEITIAKGTERLRLASLIGGFDLLNLGDRSGPPAPPSGDRFNHHTAARIDGGKKILSLLDRDGLVDASDNGNVRCCCRCPCSSFVTKQLQHFHCRTNKGQSGVLATTGKHTIFR